jgi:hypothetical protein
MSGPLELPDGMASPLCACVPSLFPQIGDLYYDSGDPRLGIYAVRWWRASIMARPRWPLAVRSGVIA